MSLRYFFFLLLMLSPQFTVAKNLVYYQGTAKVGDRIVYIEKHEVEYDDSKKLVVAKTRYESSDGKLIAELNSDFRNSLTAPEHTIKDLRSGGVQGVRRNGSKFVLFDQEEGKVEKNRVLEEKDADGRLFVGCQGLNYYLLANLEPLEPGKKLLLRFLIPGKLDYYDFDLSEISRPEDNIAEYEIAINNWFLKIFAPTLRVKYDRKLKRIIWYEGISNIKSDKGENQKVQIEYEYEKGTLL